MFSPCAKIKEIMVAGHPVLSHLGYCTDDDDPTYVEGDTSRNTKAKDDCRIRDNYRCKFIGAADAQAAHIIPFSWNENVNNSNRTARILTGARAFFSKAGHSVHQNVG
ncbi:hypothetical protein FPOAC2_07082 [Fusarium poae]